jgi:hypothetical protein
MRCTVCDDPRVVTELDPDRYPGTRSTMTWCKCCGTIYGKYIKDRSRAEFGHGLPMPKADADA